jgi:glycine/D-amino acid oxidase-like deaminating enzyme
MPIMKIGKRMRVVGGIGSALLLAAVALPFFFPETPLEFDPNDGLWAQEPPPANPALGEDLVVDVAVVGGGYTGLSAAWHLAKADPKLKIVVLEARQVGNGASGRHGGMVLPQTGAESFEVAWDDETHKWTYDLTVQNIRNLRRFVEATGLDCDLVLNGYCHAIWNEEDLPYYTHYVARARKMGIPLQFWDEDKTAAKLGTDRYCGAVFDPNGGQVHALKLIRALKRGAEDAGVRIVENSPVLSLQEGKTIRLAVGAAGHVVTAGAVVLAANGFISKLGYFKNQIMPMHAQCASTPPLTPAQLQAIGWKSRLPFFDSRYMLYHLVLTPDNRIVMGGGSAEYFVGNKTKYAGDLKAIADLMHAELAQIYPALKDVPFDRVWDGVLGITFDGIEAVGVRGEHKNIYYGLAYNGHGVNLSFLFGDIIAHMYRGEEHDWQETAYAHEPLRRMPPDPYKWLGVQTMTRYYLYQDR